MPPKQNPQAQEEQRNASQGNGLFNDDPFAGAPDPFGEYNPPVEKDNFDPDFGPSGFNGKEFTAMTPAEKEAYNNDVAAIMDELSKTHTVNDDKLHEVLLDASKHGMLYHPNGEMVSEQNLETLFETLPYVYDANPDRAAYAFSDFIVVEYNPVTEGITDRTFDIDDGSVSMDKAKFLEVEDIYKEKYRYNERLVRREEINARLEATIAENPANRVALQQAVEEVDVPGKSDFDVDYGPDGFNGKKFVEMTDEEKRAYNKDVSEIIDVLAERHYSSDSIFRETMFKACQHGMLYYPDGQMVTEPILEDVFDKARNETNPYWTAHVFSRFVLVEYDPLEKSIGHTEFQHDRGEITMYVPKEDYLDDEGILQKKVDYEEDLAFIERRTAEVIAEREAQWEAERVAQREAQYAALSEEERTALSGENNAPAEEKLAKPFEFTRSVAVENADGVVSSKKFEEMTPDEQSQFFNRNETVLRGLEASETEEDMALWLNDAASRGILFRRDGSAVAPNAVGDELAKIDETIDKAPFLSDLVFANYNPATKTLGFHPFIVEENKIVVNSEKPLSAAELDQLYKGGVNLPVEEPVAPVQASVAPVDESDISLDDVDVSPDNAAFSFDEDEISLEDADAYIANLDTLSPKELVEELAASVQELNSAKSNAITNKLKELKLYADLGYTTKDGVRHEKGCIKVGDDVYLRGETTPVTPEKFTRFIEGVQPPKKPSGFFSGVREWWHKNISKLDDFTKYEERMREYEITKYYTCAKAGIPVEKTDAVKAYEKEAAVQLFIGAHFRDLQNEWVKKLTTDSDFDKTLDSDELKEEMLKSTELQAFIDNPATQKYLRQYYGEDFVIFGRGGRKLGGVNAETKAQFIAAGERVCEGCKWGILSENADTAAETDLYAVMDRIAKSDVQAAHDAAFMENLETVLRKDTPVSKQILNKLSEMSSEELADFRYTCSVLNKNDEPFSVELTAADKGLLSKMEEDAVINEQCAHWLKPLEALAAGATEDEKAFVDAFKQAFADHPYLARDVMHELGTIDEKFLETMAPAVEQYAQIKDYDCMKKTYGMGVLEVIVHNGLFFGDNASREIFERIEHVDAPIHSHEEFWARVEIEEWSQDFNKFAHNDKTFAFVADFRAAVLSHPDIGAKIMNEHKTIDQDFMNKLTPVVNSYSKSEKLGKLGALVAAGKTGLFTEETNKLIDKACKAVDPDYVSPFASAKLKPSQMSAQERAVNAQHGTQNIESGDKAILVEKAKELGVDLKVLDLDKIDLNDNNIVVGGGNEAGVVDLDDEPAREQSQMDTTV